MKKFIYLVFIFVLSISCADSDWNTQLGNGYAYLRTGGAMDIDVYPGNAITFNSLFEDPIVFPEIENYKFNDDFIVCKQNYKIELVKKILQSSFESRYREIYYHNSKKEYFGIVFYIQEYKNNSVFYNRCLKLKNRNHIGFTKSIIDSIVSNNPLFLKMERQKENYYIIDKKRKKNYLVLNKIAFSKLCRNLKIPDSLKIE